MGLQTNGWDYGYHISHKQSNKILKDKSTNDSSVLSTFLTELGNLNISGTDQSTLNVSIVEAIKSKAGTVKKIDGFSGIDLSTLGVGSHDNTVWGYLSSILEAILILKHKANKRELLSLCNDKVNEKSYSGLTDVDEINHIKNRSKIYLEYHYPTRLYDLKTTALATYNGLTHNNVNTLWGTLDVRMSHEPTDTNILDGLVKTLLSALVPVNYIDKAVFFTNDVGVLIPTNRHNYFIRFNKLSEWQFLLGGSQSIAKIQYNIDFDCYKVTNSTGIVASELTTDINTNNISKISFDVLLNMNWISNANTPSNLILKESINLLSTTPLLRNSVDPLKPDPTDAKGFLDLSIAHYINKNLTPYYILDNAGSNIATISNFATTDSYHRYHHVFAHFNIAAYDAVNKDLGLAWIFPTTTAYAIQDEAAVPPKLENSVLSICCMINGKTNRNPATADLNAIPYIPDASNPLKNTVSSALIIERSVFAEHMVKAAFAKGNKLFDVNDGTMSKSSAYSFSNSGETTLKINSSEVTLNSSSAEVTLNSNSGEVILNSNSGEFILNSNSGEVILNINSGEVILKIGNGLVIRNGVILTSNSGEVKLNSSSGEVKLNINSSEVLLNSRRGEVTLKISSGEVKLKSNNGEVKLKSKDYLNSKNTGVEGIIPAEKLNISVEESSIKVAMSDVEYEYNSKNTPTINQEYIFNLEYQKPPTGKPDSIIKSTSKEKLFIIENNFKPNITGDWVLNTIGPFVKNILLEPVLKSLFDKRRGFQPTGFIKVENEKKKVESNQILQDPRSRNVSHLSNAYNPNDSVNDNLNQSIELQNIKGGDDEEQPLSERDKRKVKDGNNKPNTINKVGHKKTKNAQSDEFKLEYTLNSSCDKMYINLIIRKISNIVETIKRIDEVKDKVKRKKLSQAEREELDKQKKYIRHLIDCINNFEFGDDRITRRFCGEYESEIKREDRYQKGIYEKDVEYLGQLESPKEFKGYLFDPKNEVFKVIRNNEDKDLQEKVKQIIEKLELLDKVRIENEVEHIPLTEIIETYNEICSKLNQFSILTKKWK